MIGLVVDTIGLYTRFRERKKILKKAQERYEYHLKHSPILRKIIVIKSPKDQYAAELFKLKDSSAIVVFDCSLELSNTEKELNTLWNEAKRVTGFNKDGCEDLLVINIQKWASNRINLDPRIRFIILECPPDKKDLKYKEFGKRNNILAETRLRKGNVP